MGPVVVSQHLISATNYEKLLLTQETFTTDSDLSKMMIGLIGLNKSNDIFDD